jgi:hypothetical protein
LSGQNSSIRQPRSRDHQDSFRGTCGLITLVQACARNDVACVAIGVQTAVRKASIRNPVIRYFARSLPNPCRTLATSRSASLTLAIQNILQKGVSHA